MATDFEVIVRRSTKLLTRQKFYAEIQNSGNHETLFTSEMYRDKSDVLYAAHMVADRAGARVLDLTTFTRNPSDRSE